ncbi:MAG: hypothetical protein O9295_04475 [Microcystis sp. LE18-22.4A]|jgi:hypothetical protein|uniref:DUF7919 family protein n=1 Tax=Microcystis sp. LE18-22.4A TaxID=3016432 RepID=UPI0022C7C6F7|nr:hypothetical protein [Microcystis sp. LE18-22.4A]MCZ8117330.1 hypothetical protein [Microcystis sp. LE18-22.4A]
MLFRLIVSNLAKGIRKTAMTYYKDLTPYEYFARHEPPVLRGERMLTTLNVGWLSGNKSYSKGETSQEFKDTLFQLCLDEYIVNIARGFHVCELCRDISYEQWCVPRYGEKTHWLNIGTGEIRVIGQSAIYAAPTLIYHYVVEHQYKPPDEFIEAVVTGPSPESEEYQALRRKFH